MRRAQAVCGKQGNSCEYGKEKKIGPFGMKYKIVERLALALNEEKAAKTRLFGGTKGVAKGAKGHRKTKHQLPAVHF